jgi:hypothetical protein
MKLTYCFLLTVSLLAQDSAHSGALVINAGEGWSIDGRSPMRGDVLPALSSISGRPHADGLILECGKKGWLAYECGNKICRIPVCSSWGASFSVQRMDSIVNDRDAIGSPDSMLPSFLSREPREVVTLGVRGAGITDGVVLQDTLGVHLASVLDPILDGTHCFRFSTLPASNVEYATPRIAWRHSEISSGTAKVKGLMPGLYTIEKLVIGTDGACVKDGTAQHAWVLVTTAADFGRIAPEWQRVSSRLNHLAAKPGVDPTVVSTVHRIFLSYWADNLSKR